jgi:hypothetical protein
MSFVEKFLAKEATSLARSVLQSNAKQGIKSFIQRFKTKSADQIRAEVTQTLGYLSCHYSVNKQQEIVYKPSVVFVREWLTNSPTVANKLIKDEESGQIFVDGHLMDPARKMDLINDFMKQTGIRVASLNSHFDGALKLLDVTDFTSQSFKKHFAGWNPTNESIIDNFLPRLYGEALETEAKYATFLFRKWIIGTAKRAMEPGVAFDGCLVLTGPGGVGKTSFFRELLPGRFFAISRTLKNSLKEQLVKPFNVSTSYLLWMLQNHRKRSSSCFLRSS